MSIQSRLRSWRKALGQRLRLEDELETELRFHVDSYAEDLMRAGLSRDDAVRKARAELGSIASQKEQWRSSVGLRIWDDLRNDMRYAFRQLRHSPAFTVTVLLVLALGIGANAAMFSIIDVTLLRWLPYHRPGKLVSLSTFDASGKPSWIFLADIEQWQQQSRTLAGLAYYSDDLSFVDAPGGGRSLTTPRVSANLFEVLGVRPSLGRGFLPDEQTPGRDKVVVLSEPVWRSLFAADRDIVGKKVKLDDEPYTVIGVMPRNFLFPANETQLQAWVPATSTENSHKRDFSAPNYSVIGRMVDGVNQGGVAVELSGIQRQLAPMYKKVDMGSGPSRVEAIGYRDTLVKEVRPALTALLVAVGIIWLIACANVSSLMLARATSRQTELAVRGALGASRERIVRQLFTESLLLSASGGLLGLAFAQVALFFFNHALTTRLNLPRHLFPNPTVLCALLVLAIASACLFGLFPAWLSSRISIERSLRQGASQSSQGREKHRLQQAIVIGEISLSLVLLVSCGLVLRSVYLLRRVPLGFRTDHVLLLEPQLPPSAFRGSDAVGEVYRPLLERVQHMNGVQAASLTTVLPLRKGFQVQLTYYLAANNSATAKRIDATLKAAGPELQDVLGFRMYSGRFFNQQDTPDSQPVVVVNRTFADLYGDHTDLLNRFSIGSGKGRQAKIVGIMDDFHQESIDHPPVPEIDFCAAQLKQGDSFYQPTMQAHIELAIRTLREPSALIRELRGVMTKINPELEASTIQTMDQVVEDSMGSQVLAAHLLELFAGSALLVVLAGLYGLLIYLVAQRNRELGVRLALGAQRRNILEMLLLQAGRWLAAGIAIGLVLSYLSSRLLGTFLYGVGSHDPRTMAGVTALLFVGGLLASYVPARKASLVDPLRILRGD